MQQRLRKFGPFLLYPIDAPRLRRCAQVLPGLAIFGIAMGLAIKASLGVSPWTVFHQGVSQRTGFSVGTVTMLTGIVILGAYPLIKEPLGIGTLLNALIVGPAIDVTLWIVPDLTTMPARLTALALAPVLLGFASGLYIGAGLGPGPRDGIMTYLERRGLPVWQARAIVEFTALSAGWLLGGNVGLGTVWMAASVGFFVDLFLRPPLRLPATAPVH